MSLHPEDLVEHSCCGRTSHPHLKYGTGSGRRIPELLRWDCVNNICTECGIDRKLKLTACKILSESDLIIDVLEWIDAPRQGLTKQGKQNTQLELGLQKVSVKDVVQRLKDALEACHVHQAQ